MPPHRVGPLAEGESFQTLFADGEFILSRGPSGPGRSPALILSTVSAHPSAATLARLEHMLRLREELDSAWAVRPLTLARQGGQATLVIEDPGGELLVRRVGRPWEIVPFLRTALALAAALGHLHERALV